MIQPQPSGPRASFEEARCVGSENIDLGNYLGTGTDA